MSEITDLAKTIREENAANRAQTESIASGEGPYTQEQIEIARKTLKKQDEQRALTKRTLGISERRMQKAEELNTKIQAQEQIMAEQKEALEAAGVDANNSEQYQKEQAKLDKIKAQRDKVSGAAKKEDEQKAKFRDSRTGKILGGIKDGIFGMSKSLGGLLKDKAKAGVSSIFGLLKKLALGGLALAAIAFLNNPAFGKMMDFIKDKVIPVIGNFYNKILVPLFNNLKIYFFDVIESFSKFFDDPGLKNSIDEFKKGNFFEGFKGIFGTIFKKDGLFDNLAKNILNFFQRLFGFEESDSFYGALEIAFKDFSIKFKNYFIDMANTFFKVIGIDKELNRIGDDGEKILTEEQKLDKKIKAEKEAAVLKADPELQKQKKEIAAMPVMGKVEKPEDIEKAFTLRRKKIAAEKEFEENIDKAVRQVDNKEIAEKRMVGRSFDARIGKLQDQLDKVRIKGIEKPAEKKFIDRIKLLEKEISRIKSEQRAKENGAKNNTYNSQTLNQKQGDNTSIHTKNLVGASKSFNAIQAAMN